MAVSGCSERGFAEIAELSWQFQVDLNLATIICESWSQDELNPKTEPRYGPTFAWKLVIVL